MNKCSVCGRSVIHLVSDKYWNKVCFRCSRLRKKMIRE